MCRILTLFILFVCAFPNNAEISIGMLEHLVTHVNSLEQTLSKMEEKLGNVQKELEEQKQINRIQAVKWFAHKKVETQKGEFNLEENKLDRHETIKRMKFDEHLTCGNMLYKEIKRRYHDDKGDINRKDGYQEREKVAFSAFLSRDLSNLGPGHTIQYGATHLNEGHAFNANTGVFTVPVDGVYLFAFACEDDHNRRIYADIVVDGKRAVVHSMGTNVVILRLIQGQSVWVAIDAGGHGNSLQNTATTFSGVFLYY